MVEYWLCKYCLKSCCKTPTMQLHPPLGLWYKSLHTLCEFNVISIPFSCLIFYSGVQLFLSFGYLAATVSGWITHGLLCITDDSCCCNQMNIHNKGLPKEMDFSKFYSKLTEWDIIKYRYSIEALTEVN